MSARQTCSQWCASPAKRDSTAAAAAPRARCSVSPVGEPTQHAGTAAATASASSPSAAKLTSSQSMRAAGSCQPACMRHQVRRDTSSAGAERTPTTRPGLRMAHSCMCGGRAHASAGASLTLRGNHTSSATSPVPWLVLSSVACALRHGFGMTGHGAVPLWTHIVHVSQARGKARTNSRAAQCMRRHAQRCSYRPRSSACPGSLQGWCMRLACSTPRVGGASRTKAESAPWLPPLQARRLLLQALADMQECLCALHTGSPGCATTAPCVAAAHETQARLPCQPTRGPQLLPGCRCLCKRTSHGMHSTDAQRLVPA